VLANIRLSIGQLIRQDSGVKRGKQSMSSSAIYQFFSVLRGKG